MPRRTFALLLRLGTAALTLTACQRTVVPPTPTDAATNEVRSRYLHGLDSLIAAVAQLDSSLMRATLDSTPAVQARFGEARARYKRVEYLVEYFTPGTADGINGPALDDMAEDDPNRTVIPPEGFQVVEELVYPALALHDAVTLRSEMDVLLANVRRARYTAEHTPLTRAAILDAVRLQWSRIPTLGLVGFDSPVALRGVEEAAVAVRAIIDVLRSFEPEVRAGDPSLADSLFVRLERAEAHLLAACDLGFESFDRLAFITEHVIPVGDALARAQAALGARPPIARRAWRADAPTVFARNAFDPVAFAPFPHREATPAQVALGRALFFDPLLSRGRARACASCHQPVHGYADTARTSIATSSTGAPLRNTPTVLNSALQHATFADLRTAFLEDQVSDVVANADEMHGSLEDATAAVAARPDFVRAFRTAFSDSAPPTAAPVTSFRVRLALAAYLRSLQALDARFDRYLQGDRAALTDEERHGFNVFMGKGKCGTCHFAPLFNGVVPPTYARTESEVLGVPARAVTRRGRIDPDSGRARITRLPLHLHAFKTPTLRNVGLTAPYMHNGAYRTLEEVVEFYNLGGGAGIGIHLPNQTLPPDALGLTTPEKRALVAFMRALTDSTSVPTRP